LKQLDACLGATYRICTSTQIDRNLFDRPTGPSGEALPRTITWNPELRSELEPSCDGDVSTPVLRDPTASLVHELAHAVQDCTGLNPGEHELEAVRIENIYRRAAGLCQRHSYGDLPLPVAMVKVCSGNNCPCSPPRGDPRIHEVETRDNAPPMHTADSPAVNRIADGAPR